MKANRGLVDHEVLLMRVLCLLSNEMLSRQWLIAYFRRELEAL